MLVWEAPAVAKAAMDTGVAQKPVDLAEYREQLEKRLGKAHELMRIMIHKAQANPKRVVFPEGSHQKILRACHVLVEEKIAIPVLLGRSNEIQRTAAELGIPLDGITIVEPETAPRRQEYVKEFYRLRQRRGVTLGAADELMNDRNIFGSMMVRMGDADALVSGVTQNYPDTIRPALQVIGVREGIHKVSGIYIIITRKGDLYFLADATVNIEPTAEDLAEIALCVAQEARRFNIEPRVAMLSFSSFGSTKHPLCDKMRRALELVRYADPTLIIDGEVQGDIAVNSKKLEAAFPFSAAQGRGQCAGLPRFAVVQHRLQAAGFGGRRGVGRPDSDGHGEAGASAATRCRGRGHRQYVDHRCCGRARQYRLPWRGPSQPQCDSHITNLAGSASNQFPQRASNGALFLVAATSGCVEPKILTTEVVRPYGIRGICLLRSKCNNSRIGFKPLLQGSVQGRPRALRVGETDSRLLGASIGWRNSWPNRLRMCNWALRFRTGFRPFSFPLCSTTPIPTLAIRHRPSTSDVAQEAMSHHGDSRLFLDLETELV